MKSISTLLILFINLIVFGQKIDFSNPPLKVNFELENVVFTTDSVFGVDFQSYNTKRYDMNFSGTEIQKNLNFLSFQVANRFLPTTYNENYSEIFLTHCGPLEQGLYLPVKGEDAIVSHVFDNLLNKYLLPKLFSKGK